MLFSSEGVKPDTEKIKAREDLHRPKNKEEHHLYVWCRVTAISYLIFRNHLHL